MLPYLKTGINISIVNCHTFKIAVSQFIVIEYQRFKHVNFPVLFFPTMYLQTGTLLFTLTLAKFDANSTYPAGQACPLANSSGVVSRKWSMPRENHSASSTYL